MKLNLKTFRISFQPATDVSINRKISIDRRYYSIYGAFRNLPNLCDPSDPPLLCHLVKQMDRVQFAGSYIIKGIFTSGSHCKGNRIFPVVFEPLVTTYTVVVIVFYHGVSSEILCWKDLNLITF